jgi:peptide/nickel transport system substrate-binding protein
VNAQLGVVRASFEKAAQDRAIARLHEILIEEAALLAVVHDLNPRALSPRCRGFVQAKSWFQDYTQIAVS